MNKNERVIARISPIEDDGIEVEIKQAIAIDFVMLYNAQVCDLAAITNWVYTPNIVDA